MSGMCKRNPNWSELPISIIDHRCACGAKATIFGKDRKQCEACFEAETSTPNPQDPK